MESELPGMSDISTTQQNRGEGKGKEPATDAKQPDAGDSMLCRIGKSAADLSRSIIRPASTTSDLADVVASGKPRPPSSSKHVALEGSSSAAPTTSGIRSGQTEAHTAAEEQSFSDFLDSTMTFVLAAPAELEPISQEPTRGSPGPTIHRNMRAVVASSVAEQQERDGLEVVRILSRLEKGVPNYEGEIVVSETELKGLRQALFGDGSPAELSANDWDNALNFVPEILGDGGFGSKGPDASADRYSHLGVTDPAEAGSLWLEQWNRVLTSYTDEVWGDLSGIVKRAQTEIEQVRQGSYFRPATAPAVQQLRSILTHVRARL